MAAMARPASLREAVLLSPPSALLRHSSHDPPTNASPLSYLRDRAYERARSWRKRSIGKERIAPSRISNDLVATARLPQSCRSWAKRSSTMTPFSIQLSSSAPRGSEEKDGGPPVAIACEVKIARSDAILRKMQRAGALRRGRSRTCNRGTPLGEL